MFLLKEIGRHRKEIRDKFGLNGKQLFNSRTDKKCCKIVPLSDLKSLLSKLEKISPDMSDLQYIALCLKLGLPLWSNDARLKKQS